MAALGAPSPVLATPVIVSLPNPQPALSLPGGNRSSPLRINEPTCLRRKLVCVMSQSQADPAAIKTSRLIVRGPFEPDGDNRAFTSSRTAQRSASGSVL